MSRAHQRRITALKILLTDNQLRVWCILSRKQRGEEVSAEDENAVLSVVFPIIMNQHTKKTQTSDLSDSERMLIMKVSLTDPHETDENKKRAADVITKIVEGVVPNLKRV